MATTQPQQFTTDGANRLVWVLNLNPDHDYKEEFRGDKITIPKNQQRIPKHVNDGGNLMQWISARKFLGEPRAPAASTPHGEVINIGKPLRTVELTDEERETIQGPKPKKTKEEEQAAQNTCPLCVEPTAFASKKGLENHYKKAHPDRASIEEVA